MDRQFMKALAQMCKAFLKIYEENINLEKKLEQVQIDFPYEIEKRDKEICYLNSLLEKSPQQSAQPANTMQPESPRLCELCGKPVAKPTHRFCCTSCQVKFSHRQRGHNTDDKPAPKRRYSRRNRQEANTAPKPQPEATPQGATEEKVPDAGK